MIDKNKEHVDEQISMVEATIDDMNPEFYGYIMGQLFDLGANDVYIEQVLMKKNRPGQVLHVICSEEIREKIMDLLFLETTTLGVRYTPYIVHRLEREWIEVKTVWGECRVKVGKRKGNVVQISPEYEDCVKLAKKNQVPLKMVYDQAKRLGVELI